MVYRIAPLEGLSLSLQEGQHREAKLVREAEQEMTRFKGREADNSQRKAEQETARLQIELAAKETARWQREADETHNDKLVAVVREGSRIEREASQRASDALVCRPSNKRASERHYLRRQG